MQNFNFHSHTYRCGHANKNFSDEEYVVEYINNGFKKIAFTDHCPQKVVIDHRRNMRMEYSQKEDYYNSVKVLQEKYKDSIEIELGFEVEYHPSQEKNLLELKKETNKLVLGQHFVEDKYGKLKIVGGDLLNNRDLTNYAEYIETAMKKGIPDVVVHPDIYMYGRKKFGKMEAKTAHAICKAAEKYGVPLEINLSKVVLYMTYVTENISYPRKEFWEIASKYNVKVIYGIDAHYREQINLYKESIKVANEVIGQDVIDKLNFCESL